MGNGTSWKKQGAWLVGVTLILAIPSGLFGQGVSTSSINGTVKDATGAVVPGATIEVTNLATNTTYNAVSNEVGNFTIAGVSTGTYRVTVTATGFKKEVIENAKVNVGVPAAVNPVLEVGQVSDQVIVTGGAEILDTVTASVGTTIDQRRIQELPLSSRDALDLTMLQAGVATTGNPRSSVVNGLRKASINITIDGINVQDNNLRSSDGYFTYLRPRIDAVEEFTITTSTAGVESSGGGAVNIKFVTRSGTNDIHGSAYWYHRNPALNANYYFNNEELSPDPRTGKAPRTRILLNQYGACVGGPIRKDKLFYFTNYEEYRLPNAQNRRRTILNADASQGRFVYQGTDGQRRTVDLLALARANGFPSTIDPTVQSYINTVNSNATGGVLSNDLRTNTWSFNNTGADTRRFLTSRFDYKITPQLSWDFVGNYDFFDAKPDFLNNVDRFAPGFSVQGSQHSNRWGVSSGLRYAVTPSLTNEARYGMVGGTVQFSRDIPVPQFRFNSPPIISNPFGLQPSSSRNAPAWFIQDNLSWTKGTHFLSFGTEVTFYRRWQETVSNTSPNISLAVATRDPANTGPTAFFTTANLPFISPSDMTVAQNLWALLVGRISGVTSSVYADERTLNYVVGSPLIDRFKQNEIGIFAQDSWKVFPTLTLNYGLRWEFISVPDVLNKLAVLPANGLAGIWGVSGVGNLFKPGTLAGSPTQLDLAGGKNGRPFYKNDWNNFAPAVGFAWMPSFDGGFLRKLFGAQGKSVFRGGYNISYIRDGFVNTTGVVGQNAGQTASGGLTVDVMPPAGFPAGSLLLRNPLPSLFVAPDQFAFPTPQGTEALRFRNQIAGFDPNLRTPYVQSWSLSFEREIFKDTVLEFRYVGNHGVKLWRRININEVNIFENGFLNEFRAAQNNLRISRANTGGQNFRNQGLPGQVDLPIFTALFGSAASANFGNTTFLNDLDNGTAGRMATDFARNATFYRNLVEIARYPANFWVANPDAPLGATVVGNYGDSNYHSFQIEMRRRFTRGIFTQANYTYGRALANDPGNITGTNSFSTLRNLRRDYARADYDITQRLNLNFLWEPPVGRNRSFLSGGALGKILEGWQLGGIARIQSGNPFELVSGTGRATVNQLEPGVVLKGITRQQLQDLIQVRKDPTRKVFYFPANLIGADGRANPDMIGPPTTPGEWGGRIILDGPRLIRFDLSIVKKTYITEKMNVEFRAELFNAFNNINFLAPLTPGTTTLNILATDFGRIYNAYRDVSTTNDPGARWIQFVLRFNW